MGSTRDVEEHIARWQDRGLLADGQAQVLLDDARAAQLVLGDTNTASSDHDADASNRLLSAAITAGLEALGYLGAALVGGALLYLFDIADWPRPALLALLAGVTAVSATAAHRLAPADAGAPSRLVTVIGTAGLASTYGFMALLFDPWCTTQRTCGWVGHRLMPIVFVAPGLAFAAWLFLKERNAVTHAWLGGSVAAGIWMLSLAFVPLDGSTRHEEVASALFLLPAAVAWIWATETGRIRPAWIGTFGAGWLAGVMLLVLADLQVLGPSSAGPPLALLLHGASFVAAGVRWKRWRLTLVGSLALVFATPWTLTEVFELSERATALLLLPVGLALLTYVVRELRPRART